MTSNQTAVLVRDQYDVGLTNGPRCIKTVFMATATDPGDNVAVQAELAAVQANANEILLEQANQVAAMAKAMVVNANAALASSQAAALRFNNVLSSMNTTIRGAATTGVDDFVAGLVKGEGVMQSLKDAATDVGKALTNAGLNSLVTTGLNALAPSASQTASATASATILTTAGTALAASMVAGATSAAAILGTGGTVAGTALVTDAQVAGVGIDVGTSVGGAALVTGGASAGGFITSAAAILDVSTASLAAVLGPLAAVAAVAVGVGMVFGANKQVSTSEGRQDNERNNYSKAA